MTSRLHPGPGKVSPSLPFQPHPFSHPRHPPRCFFLFLGCTKPGNLTQLCSHCCLYRDSLSQPRVPHKQAERESRIVPDKNKSKESQEGGMLQTPCMQCSTTPPLHEELPQVTAARGVFRVAMWGILGYPIMQHVCPSRHHAIKLHEKSQGHWEDVRSVVL